MKLEEARASFAAQLDQAVASVYELQGAIKGIDALIAEQNKEESTEETTTEE